MTRERRDTICATLGLILFLLMLGRVGYYETTYKIEATVTDVLGPTAEYTDTRGHQWIADRDKHQLGDTVTLVMFNNGTEGYLYDDAVRKVK